MKNEQIDFVKNVENCLLLDWKSVLMLSDWVKWEWSQCCMTEPGLLNQYLECSDDLGLKENYFNI